MANFFSRNTGNWEDGANWSSVSHTGAANTSPGVAGVDYPGSGDNANISAGHTITVTTDMSGVASAITLSCNATTSPFTGVLDFSPTNNTGLKFDLGTLSGSTSLTIQAGTRIAPIQRGKTCTLILNTGNFIPTSTRTLTWKFWGQHREHATSDIYCDILTSNASLGSSTLVVNADINPAWAANDWIWIVEQNLSAGSTTKPAAELCQVDSYNSGTKTITLKNPLTNAYTTANALVFKAKTKFVNSMLASTHTSGADYVLADNIYPSGVGGGKAVIGKAINGIKSSNINPTYSSYNSGTKTWTASTSSATSFLKGAIILFDDANINFTATSTSLIGAGSAGALGASQLCYASLKTFQGFQQPIGMVFFNTNLIDFSAFNGTSPYGHFYAYGLGMSHTSGSASVLANCFSTNSTTSPPYSMIRSYIQHADDTAGTADAILAAPFNCYFEDCIFQGGRHALDSPSLCHFQDTTFGGDSNIASWVARFPQACQFQDCRFHSGGADGLIIGNNSQVGVPNIFNGLVFGRTKADGVSNNVTDSINISNLALTSFLLNSPLFDSGEPATPINITFSNAAYVNPIVKCQNYNQVLNSFKNFHIAGVVSNDTSLFRTTAPSIKFAHSGSSEGLWFDIPLYLTASSHTITIYTNPSTGTWITAPKIFIMDQAYTDTMHPASHKIPFLAMAVQTVLTTSVWTALSLTYTPASDGVYILRLWARNGSGTVNWDDLTVT